MDSLLLFVILVSILFTISSCENEDETPVKAITHYDITGDWVFASLEFDGKTYRGCDPTLNANYDLITFEVAVDPKAILLTTECMDADEQISLVDCRKYTFANNKIYMEESFNFEISDANNFNDTVLKLKLIKSEEPNVPIDRIYTLNKYVSPFLN